MIAILAVITLIKLSSLAFRLDEDFEKANINTFKSVLKHRILFFFPTKYYIVPQLNFLALLSRASKKALLRLLTNASAIGLKE